MSPRASTPNKTPRSKRAASTVTRQREIAKVAQQANRKSQAKAKAAAKKPVQAGARKQPVNPMPRQHLAKPGVEGDLQLKPRFEAPGYIGSQKLEGKVAIITGGDSGIGRAVALTLVAKGIFKTAVGTGAFYIAVG